jgi:hypothetical protein
LVWLCALYRLERRFQEAWCNEIWGIGRNGANDGIKPGDAAGIASKTVAMHWRPADEQIAYPLNVENTQLHIPLENFSF